MRDPDFALINSRSTIGNPHTEEAAPSFSREDMLAARLRVARVLPYQSASPPFISNLSLAIFSGFLLVFAFPDWNLWSLGWVGTAPLIMAVVREQRFFRSLMLGTVTGTVFYAGSSYWVTHSMHNYGDIPLWLSYVILVIFSMTLGIFTGLFAGALAQMIKRFGGWAILAAPAVWAASEWARLQVTGMGWNPLGYSQAFQPALIQTARLGGVYLVSAIMVTASTALVFSLIYLERRRGLVVLSAAGLIALLSVLYGQAVLREPGFSESQVSAAVIQPHVPIAAPWDDPRFIEQMTARHVQLSEQAIEGTKQQSANGDGQSNQTTVAIVIWPESPMNFSYDRDPELRRRLAEFTRQKQVYLLLNSWGYKDDDPEGETIYNSAMVIAPSGERIFRYDKMALVPFGEYVPARGWLPFMDRIPALVGDITPGTSFTLGDVAGARIGTAICFEATRPDHLRGLKNEGASVFVQISNELWFGPTSAARQMMAAAIFRAVENDVEMIRATNSGLSAMIDRHGVVQDETPMMETATRVWKMETLGRGPTLYARAGDWFAITAAALSLILLAATFVREGRKETKR